MSVTVRKKIDSRIKTLLDNGVKVRDILVLHRVGKEVK